MTEVHFLSWIPSASGAQCHEVVDVDNYMVRGRGLFRAVIMRTPDDRQVRTLFPWSRVLMRVRIRHPGPICQR